MSGHVVPLAQRFWSKVRVTSGCWEWQGGGTPDGYGQIGLFGRGDLATAHRVAWLLAIGPIPDGLWVLHHCDNPPCVRPDHLFLGTRADNTADMMTKGRSRRLSLAGERNPRAKLSWTQVEEIRGRYERREFVSLKAMAAEYGVSAPMISYITLGRSWITPPNGRPLAKIGVPSDPKKSAAR